MQRGTVIGLRLDRGFFFIKGDNGSSPDVFAHFSDLDDSLPFDATLQERRVQYEQFDTPKGMKARKIQAAE